MGRTAKKAGILTQRTVNGWMDKILNRDPIATMVESIEAGQRRVVQANRSVLEMAIGTSRLQIEADRYQRIVDHANTLAGSFLDKGDRDMAFEVLKRADPYFRRLDIVQRQLADATEQLMRHRDVVQELAEIQDENDMEARSAIAAYRAYSAANEVREQLYGLDDSPEAGILERARDKMQHTEAKSKALGMAGELLALPKTQDPLREFDRRFTEVRVAERLAELEVSRAKHELPAFEDLLGLAAPAASEAETDAATPGQAAPQPAAAAEADEPDLGL